MTRIVLPLALLIAACGHGDGRFTVDLTTHYSDWQGDQWLAPSDIELFVEHTNDNYPELVLPSGCSTTDTFFVPVPYTGGEGVSDAANPRWSLPSQLDSGAFHTLDPGLYTSPGMDKALAGTAYDEFLGEGYTLQSFGDLTGTLSLPMPVVTDVYIDGEQAFKETAPILRNKAYEFTWDASSYDDAFVVLERMREENVVQRILCGVDGDSFNVNGETWAEMEDLGESERYRIRIGFDARGDRKSDEGWIVDAASRIMYAFDPPL